MMDAFTGGALVRELRKNVEAIAGMGGARIAITTTAREIYVTNNIQGNTIGGSGANVIGSGSNQNQQGDTIATDNSSATGHVRDASQGPSEEDFVAICDALVDRYEELDARLRTLTLDPAMMAEVWSMMATAKPKDRRSIGDRLKTLSSAAFKVFLAALSGVAEGATGAAVAGI